MKRICALLLCVAMLVFNAAPFVSADEPTEAVSQNAVSYTCRYDAKGKQIIIEGTVNHDFMISHSNYRIGVIAIAPGQDCSTVINDPEAEMIAEAAMSVKFVFHAAVNTDFQRYCRYAIVFTSPEGERLLGSEPRIASAPSETEYSSDRTGFKGIAGGVPSVISKYGTGTVIIDAELSKMLGDSSDSILYPMNSSYVHIRKSYIEEMDRAVTSASVNSADIYFRLLLSTSCERITAVHGDGSRYSVPDMCSAEAVNYLSTLLKFIFERYGENIYGVIAGSRIDDTESTNDIGTLSLEQYADMYTLYLTAIGNALREGGADIDVAIPISDANDFSEEQESTNGLNTAALLDAVVYRLEYVISGDFRCSVMLEAETSPLGIAVGSIGEKIRTDAACDSSRIGAENISVLSDYLSVLKGKYETAPQNIMYLWTPDASLSGTAFCCAYAYTYVQLLKNYSVSAFAVSLGEGLRGGERLLKYIDTAKGGELLAELSKYFEDTSALDTALPVMRTLIEESFGRTAPSGIKGEFQYMDFTASSVFDCMRAGAHCKYIRSDHDKNGTRALRITASDMALGDTAECVAVFEYPENYGYTRYISLCLAVEASDVSDMSLYEVTLTVGRENICIAATGVVKNGELNELFLDMSQYSELSDATYIRVSVRCLSEPTAELSLWLHELKGYSDVYTDAELEELITAQRLAERGEDDVAEEGFDYTMIFTVVGVMLAVGVVGIGLIMVLKREEDRKDE